ncbi:MAG: glycosyltransferase family 39 protein [bacterium]|nr:glycosyltransferase family 39 protein [bacterium]
MKNKTIIIIIFLLALAMRFAALASFHEAKSLIYVNDSLTYLQVAKNLLTHGVYSMEISATPHADNFRTPLYPFFLLPFVWSSASLYTIAIVQNIIASIGIVIFYWLAKKLMDHKIALAAALLGALEPFTALINSQIMTEAIFGSLFLTALILLAIFITDEHPAKLYMAALLLGLSSLARPIASPFMILLPLAGIFVYIKNKRFPFKKIGAAIGISVLVVLPWMFFTWTRLHTLSFSSINNMQLYAYHGKLFDAWRYQRDPAITDRLPEISLDPINNTFSAAAIPPVHAVGLNYIKQHWTEYLLFHLVRTPRLFTDSGYASILNGLPWLHFNFDSSGGGLLDEMLYGQFGHAFAMLRDQPVAILLLFADIGFALTALLALANPLSHYLYNKKWPLPSLFLVLFILLYTLVASPISGARFRIPINPLLFMLAIDSIFMLYRLHTTKKIRFLPSPVCRQAGRNDSL